jgi:putative GTP pyrophosphokinase
MPNPKKIGESIDWYKTNISLFQSLSHKIEDILRENLIQNNIQVHSITSRPKSLDSYTSKAKKEKYKNPKEEIKDMAGIRVITYLESDVNVVANLVEKLFKIIPEDSLDQSKLLGSNKVGYRSIHYVAVLGDDRCELPEYRKYKQLAFEIQIRSLLQHAWAEIEHDRNYKFSGKLPSELERRFFLVAGMLEVADNEFTSIAKEVEKYRNEIVNELEKGELNIEINTTSLKEYLSSKFSKSIKGKILMPNFSKGDYLGSVVIEELNLFGIFKLSDLDKIIPKDYEINSFGIKGYWNNFAGIIRDILMINNAEKYFKKCWAKKWDSMEPSTQEIMKLYNVNEETLKKYIEFSGFDAPFEE